MENKTGLVIDCCGHWLVVGLYGNGIFLERVELAPRKAFLYLHDWIAELLKEAGIKKPDWIACTRGPGSFTGVRICVNTTRNLGQLWDIPVMGMDSLGFVASQIFTQTDKPSATIAVMIDGRQKKVYANIYKYNTLYTYVTTVQGQESKKRKDSPASSNVTHHHQIKDISIEELHNLAPCDLVFFADDIDNIKSYTYDSSILKDRKWQAWPVPSAKKLYDHALKSGGYTNANNWESLLPLYIRPDPAHANQMKETNTP